jgi:hypothetical protein
MSISQIQPYGDNFIPVLPIEEGEDPYHTPTSPFCFVDPKCPCHEDPTLLAEVATQVENGLLTPIEATRLVKGEML